MPLLDPILFFVTSYITRILEIIDLISYNVLNINNKMENDASKIESVIQEVKDEPAIKSNDVEQDRLITIDTLTKEITTLIDEDYNTIASKLQDLKDEFDKIKTKNYNQALDQFIADGGEKEDFDYKGSEQEQIFQQTYERIVEKKKTLQKQQFESKEKNLQAKQNLLESLRELTEQDKSIANINHLKELQTKWNEIGQVPAQHAKNLWANYNALVNLYYDKRKIYFELRDLDHKKNLDAKIKLCEKAELIADDENLSSSELQKGIDELHHQFKQIGPIPKDEQENIWNRFKTATDKVYERRRSFIQGYKSQLEENLKLKQTLIEELAPYLEFDSDKIVEWNSKTAEIITIRERWEAIGPIPRELTKEINRKFWANFKSFFKNKSHFFKKIDAEKDQNYQKKCALLEQAKQLQDSKDWEHDAKQLKELQEQWKNIGPVPEKHRNELYPSFKAACDTFFEGRREAKKETEQGYQENLEQKENIVNQLLELAKGTLDEEQISTLLQQWAEIGFVPKEHIKSSKDRLTEALDKCIDCLEIEDSQEKESVKLKFHVELMKQGAGTSHKLEEKVTSIRKKIAKLEKDIAIWKNNMEFFAQSATANAMKKEFEQKIQQAESQLNMYQDQLNLLHE